MPAGSGGRNGSHAARGPGIFYFAQALGDSPSLDVLSVYATGGGIFFIAQAALLAWKSRSLAR